VDRTRANSTITTALLVAALAVAIFALTFVVANIYIG
jgi:uncharacterized membrane protein (DUF485 family)